MHTGSSLTAKFIAYFKNLSTSVTTPTRGFGHSQLYETSDRGTYDPRDLFRRLCMRFAGSGTISQLC